MTLELKVSLSVVFEKLESGRVRGRIFRDGKEYGPVPPHMLGSLFEHVVEPVVSELREQ